MKVYEVVSRRYIDAYSGDEWSEFTRAIFSSLEKVKEAGYCTCKEWELDSTDHEFTFYRIGNNGTWEAGQEYSVYFEGKINWSQVRLCDSILPDSYIEQVTETHIDWHCLRFLDEVYSAVIHIKEEWGDVLIEVTKGDDSSIQIFDGMASEYLAKAKGEN